jgi:hypothetical protein
MARDRDSGYAKNSEDGYSREGQNPILGPNRADQRPSGKAEKNPSQRTLDSVPAIIPMTDQDGNRENYQQFQCDSPRSRAFDDHPNDEVFRPVVVANSTFGIGQIVVNEKEHNRKE